MTIAKNKFNQSISDENSKAAIFYKDTLPAAELLELVFRISGFNSLGKTYKSNILSICFSRAVQC